MWVSSFFLLWSSTVQQRDQTTEKMKMASIYDSRVSISSMLIFLYSVSL